ncbi:MAG: hypothetical protein IKD25_05395 [Bacteroidaceae bacterium]|nr:hypothetical protein [Bacteroidaceae bacterium]
MKQIIITLIAWTAIVLNASATAQNPEVLMWNGQKYNLMAEPLLGCEEMDSLLGEWGSEWEATSSWRNYEGYWEIVDSVLYLNYVKVNGDTIYARDIPVLKPYCTNGMAKATWVTSSFKITSGKIVYPDTGFYTTSYEHEDQVEMKDGVIVSMKHTENKRLIYSTWEKRKAFESFLEDLGRELRRRFPKVRNYIGAEVWYRDYDSTMMPTSVEIVFPKKTRNRDYNRRGLSRNVKNVVREKLAKYVLEHKVFDLYYVKGQIWQGQCMAHINIPQ